jgi:hypothetical protein
LFKNWSAFKGSAIIKLLSSIWVSRSFTGLFAIEWKLAVLRGLGNKEVVAVLKVAVFNAFTLLKVIAASVA